MNYLRKLLILALSGLFVFITYGFAFAQDGELVPAPITTPDANSETAPALGGVIETRGDQVITITPGKSTIQKTEPSTSDPVSTKPKAKKRKTTGKGNLPPESIDKPESLYDKGRLLQIRFPEFFSFVADPRGLGGSGVIKAKIRKMDPLTNKEIQMDVEIRNVGSIIASEERGYRGDSWLDPVIGTGKTLFTLNDIVMVRFYEDIAKILDSETYGDSDPYFREFPVYTMGAMATEPGKKRADKGKKIGQIMRHVGKVTLVSRVEGLVPSDREETSKRKVRKGHIGNSQDAEPVSYVGRITESRDALKVGDSLFIFVPINPGPERVIDLPKVEAPGSYNPGSY